MRQDLTGRGGLRAARAGRRARQEKLAKPSSANRGSTAARRCATVLTQPGPHLQPAASRSQLQSHPYSLRSASTGSRRAAERDGIRPATTVSSTDMPISTTVATGDSCITSST